MEPLSHQRSVRSDVIPTAAVQEIQTQRLVVFLLVLWFFFRLVNEVEAYFMESDGRDHTTISGIGHVCRIILVLVGVLIGLQEFGISITGLMTFGGVGGLVVRVGNGWDAM